MTTTTPTPTMGDTTTARPIGFLRIHTLRGAARQVRHVPDADALTDPYVLLGLHIRGRATLARPDGTATCLPGDVFVRDGARGFTLEEAEDFELHLVRVPHRALALTDRQVDDLAQRAPFADGTVTPLLGPLLREIAAAEPGPPSRTALRSAGAVADLVALLAVEDTGPGPREDGQDREALVRSLRAYVDANLRDRNLTPATVAEAQHISIRYLHKLFEGRGSTVGRWIQHRRLEEARRELARPARDDITVAAVARRWGFASATHFSRSFRTAYGMSPSDWRAGRTSPAEEPGAACR
ncbi:helix-turn-helix domain-containing protein [Streptomyces sp. Je 1-369]|uniref:helix-turn-helix domain-containing protein n=1 Tax=Streptomyces sp. Je 1-369 TaxID=2966192 RepID=UPI002285EBF3|nr:helix-turn-helix domain-containing protein [Streptomyces sp. Je 1-369]WAL93201.1 helix-turn-helix domain-containing protein [Streptomyces sp. Je 1-369]